jgi:hypothetical protein
MEALAAWVTILALAMRSAASILVSILYVDYPPLGPLDVV